MAFCTQCGADVKGAFCNVCGTRAAQAPAAGAAAAPAPVSAAAPVKRGTSPIVWVLVIVLGLFGLGAVAIVGLGAYFAHRVQQDGVDGTIARVIAAANPDVEVLRTNKGDGTVTLRERSTGKEFSIGIDAARSGKFTLRAVEDGKSASLEFGGDAKAPSWVPQYPGSRPQAVFSAKGESDRETGEAGSFFFKTPDSTSKVVEFYEQKARELDLPIRVSGIGTIMAGNDDRGRFLKIVAVSVSDETTVNVTYGHKL
jgi:hypothetical protein